ncbi:alpha/beta hydrolase [Solemya velum gill symbiont]|uniref:Alpha/beta hydrolase n=1 Tax=Solemya velum gill symbiont TaxID=2340 RepID=A0A1T2CJ19_SOVGS|nr:alpha/beta hydrolase [Solemya velum gill symbiont]OOY34835.1 alpha/beta hydrolase [Solemya velum gill symbiont]OOY37550.1 alpha/beta hydrolase [Solemya velum gill symbiont]OOY40172.1 alpha/beta hydrolase [Solemya velum gill symbiont]OOY44848.1 alpha/beta hydrolase [Solemya velum gill symbiont]OOY46885.1 alpha/beta hydrolase [Solemya velum gill symbiont]
MAIGHTIIGSGPETVFVLHGWFGDYSVWEPTFPALDKETFTYVFIDYRGYGKSADIDGSYTTSEIASDTIELIDSLYCDSFHLVGHSMGGMAMQRVMLDIDDRERVKSAVGIDPVPACGAQLDEQTWPMFEGAIESDENRYNILDFTTGNRNSSAWLNYMVERSRNTTTVPAFTGYLNAWVKESFSDEVVGLETPTLVCLGEHDQAFTKEAMEATYLAWLPNSELEFIANAGHYLMQEAPVNLATIMNAFMKKHI